jgi:hypothetical protein
MSEYVAWLLLVCSGMLEVCAFRCFRGGLSALHQGDYGTSRHLAHHGRLYSVSALACVGIYWAYRLL